MLSWGGGGGQCVLSMLERSYWGPAALCIRSQVENAPVCAINSFLTMEVPPTLLGISHPRGPPT